MLNFKKKFSTIYQYQNEFINALKMKLNNNNLNISIDLLHLDDALVDVFINNILVGVISSHTEENNILSFIPDPAFFNFAKILEVDEFVKLSNKFIMSYVKTIAISDLNNLNEKNVDNFNSFICHHYNGIFMDKHVGFSESSMISFNLVKHGNNYQFVDDFHIKIEPRDFSIVLLSVSRCEVLPFSKLLGFSLEKKNSTFCLKHDDSLVTHFINFENNEKMPDITNFISNVVYYVAMQYQKMEIPTFKDFCESPDEYKKIFEMTLI